MNSIEFKFTDDKAYGNMGGHSEGELIINMSEAIYGPKVYIKAMDHKFMVNCQTLKAGLNILPFRFSVPVTTGGCCMRMVLPGQYQIHAIVEAGGKKIATTQAYFNVEAQNFPMFGGVVVAGARSN